jgi:hypothetical protein
MVDGAGCCGYIPEDKARFSVCIERLARDDDALKSARCVKKQVPCGDGGLPAPEPEVGKASRP